MVGLVIPLNPSFGPLRMSPYRMVLLVMFVPLALQWASGALGPIRRTEIYILIFCGWGALSYGVLHDFGTMAQASGIMLIECFGAYLLARRYIRSAADFRAMVRLFMIIIFCMLPFALFETITGTDIVLKIVGSFAPTFYDVWRPERWGLDRVQAGFEHPILFGIFCGASTALVYTALGYGRPAFQRLAMTFGVIFTAALAFSSGPLTAVVGQLGLIGWNMVMRPLFPKHWWLLFGLSVLAWITIDILSNRSPPEIFISYFTFDPHAAFNRVHIWNYGVASVIKYPVLGIGFNDWERAYFMSTSFDMFWLLYWVRHGVVAGVALLAIFFSAFFATLRVRIENEYVSTCRRGLLMSLFGLFLCGWTVHYWNTTFVLLMFLIGCTGWIRDYKDSETDSATEPAEDTPQPSRRIAIGDVR